MLTSMAKRDLKLVTFRIEEADSDALDELSSDIGISKSDIARLAIGVGLSVLRQAYVEGKRGYAALAELEALKRTPPEEESR